MLRRVLAGVGMVLVAAAVAACGDPSGPDPDPAVAPFVGTWDADSLTIVSDADTTVIANILLAGSFFITVEPSGQYTATLTVAGMPSPEIGQLTVLNSTTLTLAPSFPAGRPVATAQYFFQAADFVILDGPTEFDFNRDGTPEPSQVHFELQRQ